MTRYPLWQRALAWAIAGALMGLTLAVNFATVVPIWLVYQLNRACEAFNEQLSRPYRYAEKLVRYLRGRPYIGENTRLPGPDRTAKE